MMTLYVIVESDCIRVICAFYRENPSCRYKVPASFSGSNPNFTRPNVGYLPVVEVNRRERERIWIGCCVLSESVNYIEGFEVARKAVIMYYASLLFK